VSVRKSFLIATRSLRRNRLQTLLTVLGMMIGVATVLAMIAIGSGAEKSITGQVRAAGMNVIVVSSGNYRMPQQWTSDGEAEEPTAWSPGETRAPLLSDGVLRYHATRGAMIRDGVAPRASIQFRLVQNSPADNPNQQFAQRGENQGGTGAATTLTLGDATAISGLQGVQAASGGVHDNASVTSSGATWITQMRGEQSSLPEIRRAWVMIHGRFFTADEDTGRAAVAVLGSIVSQRLFGDLDPVGHFVTVRGVHLHIIGVVASGSWMVPAASGDGQFDAVYLPVRAAQDLLGRPYLDTITVSTISTGEVTRLTKQIAAELRSRHRLGPTRPDDFTVASQAHAAIVRGGMRTDISRSMMGNADGLDKITLTQLSKTLEHASHTMAALLASIAAVSLVVGGIGIMNIMLLSVTERTREIGIRRSIGAQSSDVMQQFLLEAVILSVGGGLLGIAVGILGSLGIARLARWSTELSWIAIAVSFTISAAVGIIFGYYPARQASRVSPMTSLRYE
jgi:ABC-type antimicrobial peptide transport system permease subunit